MDTIACIENIQQEVQSLMCYVQFALDSNPVEHRLQLLFEKLEMFKQRARDNQNYSPAAQPDPWRPANDQPCIFE